MNKGLMLALFGVLLMGFSFATVTNASTVTEGATGKYTAIVGAADSAIIEGGNVTEANVTSNASTEKWAAFYGDIGFTPVLAQSNTGALLYYWGASGAEGDETVCVSTGSNFAWATIAAAIATEIDTAWSFASGSDTAALTMTTACTPRLAGAPATIGAFTRDNAGANTWETCAFDDGTGVPAKANYAFCVNTSTTSNRWDGVAGDYQLMVPTNPADSSTETYYFYMELE